MGGAFSPKSSLIPGFRNVRLGSIRDYKTDSNSTSRNVRFGAESYR